MAYQTAFGGLVPPEMEDKGIFGQRVVNPFKILNTMGPNKGVGIPNESIGKSAGVVAPESGGMAKKSLPEFPALPTGMGLVPQNKQSEMVEAAVTKSLGGIGEDGQLRSITGDVIPRTETQTGAGIGATPNPWVEKFDKMLSDIKTLSGSITPAASGYLGDTYKENLPAIAERKALMAALPSIVGMAGVEAGERKVAIEAPTDAAYKQSLADYHRTIAGIATDAEQRKLMEDNLGTMESTMKALTNFAPKSAVKSYDAEGKETTTTTPDIGTAAATLMRLYPDNPHLKKIVAEGEQKNEGLKARGYNPPDEKSGGRWWKDTKNGRIYE